MNIKNLIENKTVLYVLLFLSITNIIGYLYIENFDAIVLFIAVGYLSTFFSKNMIINLITPLIVTNLLFSNGSRYEGMKNTIDEEETSKKQSTKEKKESIKNKKQRKEDKECEGAECKPKKQTFSNQKLSPAPTDESNNDIKEKHIDYSATLESAYDNLQNMLGDKEMKHLSSDTKQLITQQKELMDTMQSMAPILKNANSVLETLDLGQVNGAMGSLTSLMGKIGMGSKKKINELQ